MRISQALTSALRHLLQWLRADSRLADLRCTALPCTALPFQRLKVKVKPEIVTSGACRPCPSNLWPETAVAPAQWHALLDGTPGLMLIDTRNAFEVAAGTFAGAVDPGIAMFSELPQWIEQQRASGGLLAGQPPVAMFCTGGIRCEKSTAYLRALGFDAVYQLRGGILRYLAEVPPAENRWQGDCFVFDERIVGASRLPGRTRRSDSRAPRAILPVQRYKPQPRRCTTPERAKGRMRYRSPRERSATEAPATPAFDRSFQSFSGATRHADQNPGFHHPPVRSSRRRSCCSRPPARPQRPTT